MEHLPLEGLIKEIKDSGLLWDVDASFPRVVTYKFVVDRDIAARALGNIFTELEKSEVYGITKSRLWEAHRDILLEFGFRRMPTREYRSLREHFRYALVGSFMGFGYYDDLVNFASAYIVKPSSEEARRVRNENIEYPPPERVVLIINSIDDKKSKPALLELMRIFYSTYISFKTPSKT